ncbi:hypothetical protein DL96DRAFT_1711070 [Flagelloscypha sp. PMI_526]|nr:hypothetical protein DL96DRAFT_1711070 [Flagelloscypha sp. PMI_526]
MDTDSHSGSPERVSDLWYTDGNLVVKAGSRLFKVHRGVLAAQSAVFADMLSFPPSQDQENFDGSPLVQMPDDPESVEYFLRAVAQPDFFLPPPAPTQYHIIAGILRIAHKYDCSAFQTRALQHFSIRCPTTLVDYTHRNYISKPIFEGYSSLESDAYSLDFLSLLHEVDALWCLPIHYRSLTTWMSGGLNTLIKGVDFQSKHYEATVDQQIAVIAGKELLTRKISTLMGAFASAPPECTQRGCQKPHKRILEAFIKMPSKRVLNPWRSCLFDFDNQTVYAFCQACRDKVKQDYKNLQKNSWDELPQMFNLPPWEELNQMKKDALGYVEEYTGPVV